MRQHVFLPLGVNASYFLWDLDINTLSVLYRNGKPQADDYSGKMPQAPDMTGYVPGTNAYKFSPHAGLKVSALELAVIQNMIYHHGTVGNVTILKAETILQMRTIEWIYNGTNGNNMEN